MEAIRLEFKPEIKAKILELLSTFSSEDLKIVQEDPSFLKNKSKLEASLAKIRKGSSKLYTIDEVDTYLDKVISE